MQIEETIRDLENHRWGFALRYARTKRCERLEALLLIAALATLNLWLLGLGACAAEALSLDWVATEPSFRREFGNSGSMSF